eukprot:COSAG06_NODE_24179_length_670_cov_1.064799_1_plen_125_part_10
MATSHCAHIRSARDPTGSSRHGRHLQRVWVQYIPAGQVPKADHTVRQRIDSSSTASASSRRRHLYPASLEMESDGVIEAMLEQTAPINLPAVGSSGRYLHGRLCKVPTLDLLPPTNSIRMMTPPS